jgi:hypothetical protein
MFLISYNDAESEIISFYDFLVMLLRWTVSFYDTTTNK